MSYVSYRFQEVRQSDSAIVECPDCNKKRRLTVSRTYYRNGFHDESETRQKNAEAIKKELAKMVAEGVLCQSCSDARSGLPIVKKVGDRWEVTDRATGSHAGWIDKPDPRRTIQKYCVRALRHKAWRGDDPAYFDTLYEAADAIVNPKPDKYAPRKEGAA